MRIMERIAIMESVPSPGSSELQVIRTARLLYKGPAQ